MPRSYPEPAVPPDFACWVLRTRTQVAVVDRRTGVRSTRPSGRWDVRGKALDPRSVLTGDDLDAVTDYLDNVSFLELAAASRASMEAAMVAVRPLPRHPRAHDPA